MGAFDYPALPHQRRHEPQGYKRAITYRPWLRDEFTFVAECFYRSRYKVAWPRPENEVDCRTDASTHRISYNCSEFVTERMAFLVYLHLFPGIETNFHSTQWI